MTRTVGGLIDATGAVRMLGTWFSCVRIGHGEPTGRTWVRLDVARGGQHCVSCGLEWCEGGQHKR